MKLVTLSFLDSLLSTSIVLAHFSLKGSSGQKLAQSYECYNCMSLSYLGIWLDLMASYFPPKNFTDHCESPKDSPRPVGTEPCHGICITIVEQTFAGGVAVGSRYMRGCVHRMLLFGFDKEWLDRQGFTRYDVCRVADRTRLLPVHAEKLRAPIHSDAKVKANLGSPESPDAVTICSCVGSKCNSYAVVINASTNLLPSPNLSVLCLIGAIIGWISSRPVQ